MSKTVFIEKWLIWILILVAGLGIIAVGYSLAKTTNVQPTSMHLYLPKGTDTSDQAPTFKGGGVLTILLGKNDVIGYYEGQLKPDGNNLRTCDYQQIRNVIRRKKETTNPKEFAIVIKPSDAASYKNTVAALDEMAINDVKKYVMVDITPLEKDIMKKR
jgi:hypothetical protein